MLAANGVDVMRRRGGGYTPTPVISHAILAYNRGRTTGSPTASSSRRRTIRPKTAASSTTRRTAVPRTRDATGWIEARANALLADGLRGVGACRSSARRARDDPRHHVLRRVRRTISARWWISMRSAERLRLGVDPLGGASVAYWDAIAERYGLRSRSSNDEVDPTFRFMTLDWDGKIRMDCSSPYAMARLVALKDRFDVAFACDTDADRHGIVTRSAGLLNPNHYSRRRSRTSSRTVRDGRPLRRSARRS